MSTFVYLNDSGSNTGQIGVLDDGPFITSLVSTQSPAPILFDDVDTGTTTWLMGVSLTGNPLSIPQTFDGSQNAFITLQSPAGIFWELQVHSDGALFTTSGNAPGALPGLPCGIPGNVSVLGSGQTLTIIPTEISATRSPVMF